MAFNINGLLNQTYFAGGSHQVNNFPGLPFFGQHEVTNPRDTSTCAGNFIDADHNGRYTAGRDQVLAMDLNHDGRITRGDVVGTKARLEAMGGNFDLNHDGKVSSFERIIGKGMQKDMMKKDLNRDGRLDAQEFDQAGGRVLVDRNRDGRLTPNESFSPFQFPMPGFGSGHLNFIDPFSHQASTSRNPSPWGGGPFGGGFGGGFPGQMQFPGLPPRCF